MIRAYAALSYAIFLASFLYMIGWLADAGVPKGISDGPRLDGTSAVLTDVALLGVFAVQHSVMARPWFKRLERVVVPAPAERATYVLLSSAAVALIVWQWSPLDQTVWNVGLVPGRVLLWTGYATGWLIVVLGTFMIGHFALFGVQQALGGDRYVEPPFGKPGFYAVVRHPIMTGFLVAFWTTPRMTVGHLLFATMSASYIVVAVRLEERDLRSQLGQIYVRYAIETPRFVPRTRRRRHSGGLRGRLPS